jgi:Rrf2 family iron-sulfur cluster assembly transcriptional regulator
MKLTSKGRFAVTAMADLAFQSKANPDIPISLTGISKRQNISQSYLEQLFRALRQQNLVKSTRGPGGGYILTRIPEKITVADIVKVVDAPMEATQCAGRGDCLGDGGLCISHRIWRELNLVIENYLQSVNLQMMINWQLEKGINPVVDVDVDFYSRAFTLLPKFKTEPLDKSLCNFVFALNPLKDLKKESVKKSRKILLKKSSSNISNEKSG